MADDKRLAGPKTSRQFMNLLGQNIRDRKEYNGLTPVNEGVIAAVNRCEVPMFIPALTDCSMGIGLCINHWRHTRAGTKKTFFHDPVADNWEITQMKGNSKKSCVIYLGGGVPKNFVNDCEVVCETTEYTDREGHEYAVNITMDRPEFNHIDLRPGLLEEPALRDLVGFAPTVSLLAQLLYVSGDLEEDGGSRCARRQAERNAELPVEVPATERRVMAIGQAKALGRQHVAQSTQHAGLAGAGLASQDDAFAGLHGFDELLDERFLARWEPQLVIGNLFREGLDGESEVVEVSAHDASSSGVMPSARSRSARGGSKGTRAAWGVSRLVRERSRRPLAIGSTRRSG